MGMIAVAGGTGGMGKAIVEQLQLTRKHPFIILSRRVVKVTPNIGS